MLRVFVLLILFCAVSKNFAQDFSFGKISTTDFQTNQIDSTAKAVVLREYGKGGIELSHQGELTLRYYYHTKILILKNEGLDKANFSIPLYKSGTQKENIESIKGVTYNIVNGKVEETDLPKSSIITERTSDNLNTTKIAFTSVREGSIIELRYSIQSPFLFNLESWSFQSDIPKIYSEFVTEIPEICVYNVNLKGGNGLTRRKQEAYDTKMESSVGVINGQKTYYIMENVPAFVEEDYMTSAENYKSILTFELARYSIPFGPSHNFSRSWDDVQKQLLESDNFGKEIRKRNIFKSDLLAQITDKTLSDLENAIKVYSYIQKQISWDKSNGMFTKNGIKDALEKRSGNVADINLSLVNALQAINIQASPVILSTRSNGMPSFTHPTISNYNYVIAHALIDSVEYLLDATDANLPFGLIPLRCINFQGRLINKDYSDWVQLKSSYTSSISHIFNGELSEEGKLKGGFQIHRYGYAALNKRNELKEYNSLEEYFEKLEEKTEHIRFLSNAMENIDKSDLFLIENFEIEVDNFATQSQTGINFNPLFIGKTIKNPFNLDSRSYPVDLGSKLEESFQFVIKLPESYKLVEKPTNINMSLPNRDARYIYNINAKDNTLEIQILSQLNKPMFLPDEYLSLKEFFSRIIQSQKLDISLQKI
ncbi:DUF3857 domain-containing protein [Sphingobacterium olei]|uniref:DUF3857 domain-containing protein n=1 Tax=Sphingobacterium olei TaxID=2571155 RepID=A0A4U0NEW3_9SPHI|nr:DUF3857 domain-containing protein [Sphingobacterium olei]TJZ52540.1 DUF3857 domain-containing protein [Sphingobacterium olei]